MPEASPAKWHLAHTTWFFETFVLRPHLPGYQPLDASYEHVFNSYYNAVGEQIAQGRRGTYSRPSLDEILSYRVYVDQYVARLIDSAGTGDWAELVALINTGLQHEQQHQELLVTDIKANLFQPPLYPTYRADLAQSSALPSSALRLLEFADVGRVEVGAVAADGFAWDNEHPRHRAWLAPFAIANRTVTNAEYAEFIDAGGYRQPAFWLSDGWQMIKTCAIEAPLYWLRDGNAWQVFTLAGIQPLAPHQPVCHISFYEAIAYANWCGLRLPTEVEWEYCARHRADRHADGALLEDDLLQPRGAVNPDGDLLGQLFGDVWEWTASAYLPYPGYRPPTGALGEYNGKFMANQMVLRGGSCATPRSHIRASYRNFFHCDRRWQFSGLRLAKSI